MTARSALTTQQPHSLYLHLVVTGVAFAILALLAALQREKEYGSPPLCEPHHLEGRSLCLVRGGYLSTAGKRIIF